MKLLYSLLAFATAQKPNVIIILTDDFGIGDFKLYNRWGKVPTPNIDKLGREGVSFRDGHSASSRCGPSRYMLLTGRYSLERKEARSLNPDTPHLAKMLKSKGYNTGMFGKKQPVQVYAQHPEHWRIREKVKSQTKNPLGWMRNGVAERPNPFIPGDYFMKPSPAEHFHFDHSFLSPALCCNPGIYFENGRAMGPGTKFATQRLYADGLPSADYKYPFFAPPYFDEEQSGTPILKKDHPRNVLVQEDFDSRDVEAIVAQKAIDFIDEFAQKDDPFFLYYPARLGHAPFNTPELYRNQTAAGIVGESIMMTDEVVGRIMDKLKEHGAYDNTLIVFTSDNGSDDYIRTKRLFGHDQNGLEFLQRAKSRSEPWSLRGGKNDIWEGGHRVPFIVRWPSKIPPRVDQENTVSLLDIYATVAEIVGVERKCNEAPDSRSLMPILMDQAGKTRLEDETVIHHAMDGSTVALRRREWKWIPTTNELYHMYDDLEESNNLFGAGIDSYDNLARALNKTLNARLAAIYEREIQTEEGAIQNC